MSEGRQESQWNQTAEIAAAIANSNPYRTKQYTPDQFNPFAAGRRQQPAPKPPKISDEAAIRIFETCWGLKRATPEP